MREAGAATPGCPAMACWLGLRALRHVVGITLAVTIFSVDALRP